MGPFPSPCQEYKRIFLWYLLWEPGQVPVGKIQKPVVAPIKLGFPGVFNSDLFAPYLQQFVNYSSCFPTWALVSLGFFSIFAYLSGFEGSRLFVTSLVLQI